MSRRWTRATWLAGLTIIAASVAPIPAVAVDGVLEIDQDCVATGCFPGDSPGFPVDIPAPGPDGGSYRLTSNLIVPDDNTSAISGGFGPVTIDLNGFEIVGKYACGTSPPACPGGSSRAIDFPAEGALIVNVHNGTIRSFGNDAVRVPSFSRVERLTIFSIGGHGIVAGIGSTIRSNTVTSVQLDGIRLSASGFFFDGVLEGNFVRSVGGNGITAGPALLLGNLVLQPGGESAMLGVSASYGQNRFSSVPPFGISMGNNVCGGAAC